MKPLKFETKAERKTLKQALNALIEDIIWPSTKELMILIRLRKRLEDGEKE